MRVLFSSTELPLWRMAEECDQDGELPGRGGGGPQPGPSQARTQGPRAELSGGTGPGPRGAEALVCMGGKELLTTTQGFT